jgi:putative modified peptide
MTEPLNGQSVDALLTRLGTDDNFRTAFLSNPARAMTSLGIVAAASLGLGAALVPTDAADGHELASKQLFLSVRDELRRQHAGAPFEPVSLDFGTRGSGAA